MEGDKRQEQLLGILLEAEGFISGEEISRRLGISRTAVWKRIRSLKEEGCAIESVSNKGYRLLSTSGALSTAEIQNRIPPESRFRDVRVYPTVDSTNGEAKRLAAQDRTWEGLVLSEEQTAGKGRRGRAWLSGQGEGIYMSFLLRPAILPQKAAMLTLVAGLAAARAIDSLGIGVGIKWPNDLVADGKKLCGILTEMTAEPDYVDLVVVGIGINCNQKAFPPDLGEKATSLALLGGADVDRNALAARVVEEFEPLYMEFQERGDLGFLLEEYNVRCVNNGARVQVLGEQTPLLGRGAGVDKDGSLLVDTDDGKRIAVQAGEVSVRGLYGYAE
ncbi:biotin--[acetyl-CoA-carboxylase] ligase [Anaerotalea alkaliphila]|uniref:Bifunctional ligase/repressor BirA n=1 Tax=Anaerotalea alkaliphila TaxID=2662126 RepID=A0A7X5HVD7_9FIRM|nr:biotin--[acetyl-CoA-carboxylase] ligase [Anaerotalea alkaliphila]NDL67211.1 biotin--[acetyl-CoA-carboxylase] ligase [Anaerotalea alkaliphila]